VCATQCWENTQSLSMYEKRPTLTKNVLLPYPTPYLHLHFGNFTVLHVFGAVVWCSLLQEARNSRIQTPCIAYTPLHPTSHTVHYTRPTPYNTRHPTLHQQPYIPYTLQCPTPCLSHTLQCPKSCISYTLHLIPHTAHTPHPTIPNTLPTLHPTIFSPYIPYTLQCPTPCLSHTLQYQTPCVPHTLHLIPYTPYSLHPS